MSILSCIGVLWSPWLILLGLLHGTDTNSSCSLSSKLSWYFINSPPSPIINWVTIRIYIWPKIWQWLICPSSVFRSCFVCPSSDHSDPFSILFFANGTDTGYNMVYSLYIFLWSTMEDSIFCKLACDYFNFITGLHRSSQKVKHWIQYELDVDFSSTL